MTSPYRLPLSAGEFEDALQKGLGRALQQAQEYGLNGLERVFLRACLSDLRYDTQCELSRTSWLFRFFSDAPSWLSEPLYVKLCQMPSQEQRNWLQWCELAAGLAQRGEELSRKGLYAAFLVDADRGYVASRELLSLEGEKGFLWLAAQLNKEDELDHYQVRRLVESFDDLAGEGAGVAALRLAPQDRVEKVLRRLQRAEPRWAYSNTHTTPEALSPEEALDQLDSYPLRLWVQKQDLEQQRGLAQSLHKELDKETLMKLLFAFMGRGLPDFDERLLKLVEHPESEVARRARWVMAHHDHPSVRAKVLEWLSLGQLTDGRLRSLTSCFQPEDLELIRSALKVTLSESVDQHTRHDIFSDLLYLATENLSPELAPLLLFVYEGTPCTICRKEGLELLLDIERLPDWVKTECRYDCAEGIRNLVAEVQDSET